MISKEKVRNQVKSRFYYLFWGIATFSVVAGQVYVGSGYRAMARSLDKWLDTAIEALIPNKPKSGGYYLPTPTPEYYNDDGVVYLKDLDPDDYIIWKEIDADK